MEIKRKGSFLKADMLARMGRLKEMVGTLMILEQFDKNNLEAKRRLADFFYSAAKQGITDLWTKVDDFGKDLISLAPEDPQGYLLRAHAAIIQLQRKSTEDMEQTRQLIEDMLGKAKSLSASDPNLYHLLGQYSLVRLAQEEDAEKREGFRQQAETYYKEGIEKNPEQTDFCYYYAVGYLIPEVQRLYLTYKQLPEEGDARKQAKAEFDRLYTDAENRLKEYMARFGEDIRYYVTLASLLRFMIQYSEEMDP